MRTLTEIMDANLSDKGTVTGEAHGYTRAYDRWFESMREEPLRVLEIGVCDPRMPGASLKGWYEYFPNAVIFGYDIVDAHQFDNDRILTFVGDQSDPADLERFVEFSGGEFDIIIDDGSHQDRHQQASLAFLFPHLEPGGQYFIEDLHVSPSTLCLLQGMLPGLPGERPPGETSAEERLSVFSSALDYGIEINFSPYISPQEIGEIRQSTERLDLVCNAKLARLSKRRD